MYACMHVAIACKLHVAATFIVNAYDFIIHSITVQCLLSPQDIDVSTKSSTEQEDYKQLDNSSGTVTNLRLYIS